jgi:hypothetical protein
MQFVKDYDMYHTPKMAISTLKCKKLKLKILMLKFEDASNIQFPYFLAT